MAPLARVVALGLPHHGTTRGNRRRQTFLGDEDHGEGGDGPVPAGRPMGTYPDPEPSAPQRRAVVPRARLLPGPTRGLCRARTAAARCLGAIARARLRLIDQDSAKSSGSARPDDPGWLPAEAGSSDRQRRDQRRARQGAQSRLVGRRAEDGPATPSRARRLRPHRDGTRGCAPGRRDPGVGQARAQIREVKLLSISSRRFSADRRNSHHVVLAWHCSVPRGPMAAIQERDGS
jgi:hypothetical protein